VSYEWGLCKYCLKLCTIYPADSCVIAPDGICEDCCARSEDGHDHEYASNVRERRCVRCFAPPPHDFYDQWDEP
jgi:hypothetical protein